MDATRDRILIDGNTAAALGCMFAGATVGAWYPITPATSLMDAFRGFCDKHRKDPETGKKRFMVVQAEDELAAAGVVVGAGWAGARAFTPTAGPGISLMSEFIGLAYYAEVPAVFFDVQRTGPSTGMPTRTQQGDLMTCAYASHGDTRHICLYPSDPEDCFDFAVRAFDLADRFQTPVFVLSDLDIGMNDWMCERFDWDEMYLPDRGKLLGPSELEHIDVFHRYVDRDGDGIAYRTLPGSHPNGAYFTRGSGHDRFGGYTEDAAEYTDVMDRIARKIDGAADAVPEPVIIRAGNADVGREDGHRDGPTPKPADTLSHPGAGHKDGRHANAQPRAAKPTGIGGGDGSGRVGSPPGTPHGIVTVGSPTAAVLEAVDWLAGRGVALDFMRIRGFPFSPQVEAFLREHALNFVVEQNRDAQLRSLILLETNIGKDRLHSIRHYGGLPVSRKHVTDGVFEGLGAQSSELRVPGSEFRIPSSGSLAESGAPPRPEVSAGSAGIGTKDGGRDDE